MQCARSPTLLHLHRPAHAERFKLQAWPGRSAETHSRPLKCSSQPQPDGAACTADHSIAERPQQRCNPQSDFCRSVPAQPEATGHRVLPLSNAALFAAAAAAASAAALCPEPALAWQLRPEPGNALSLPTWAIHVSSVYEWGLAMALMWKYADVTGEPQLISDKSNSTSFTMLQAHNRGGAFIMMSFMCNDSSDHIDLDGGGQPKFENFAASSRSTQKTRVSLGPRCSGYASAKAEADSSTPDSLIGGWCEA